jgi:hypothetical protein
MGFKGWIVRRELRALERKEPMIRKAIDWLTDPAAVGRKRSIALGAALLSGACRGVDEALEQACAAAAIATDSAWCSVNPEAWAQVIEVANGMAQAIQPGMDLATAAFAVIGFFDAWRKAKDQPAQGPIRVR